MIELCEQFRDLGHAVQEQLRDMLSEDDDADVNPNAAVLIARFFAKHDDEDLAEEAREAAEAHRLAMEDR